MRVRTMLAGAAMFALVACTKPPLDEQQKTALADSIEQYVAGPFIATFEHPDAKAILDLYVPWADLQVVENGSIYPNRDAFVRRSRLLAESKRSAHLTVGSARVAVLSRDAAVYTAMLTGALKDSSGVETPIQYAYTAVFVRMGGGWRIQAEHSSTPPAPAPAVAAKPARRGR